VTAGVAFPDRVCDVCEASLDGKYANALTCGTRCRKRRERWKRERDALAAVAKTRRLTFELRDHIKRERSRLRLLALGSERREEAEHLLALFPDERPA
jgi:hypothetical protein